MTFFWIATVTLAVAMAGLLVMALIRGQRNTGPAEAFDLQVYRDQLTEVDRCCWVARAHKALPRARSFWQQDVQATALRLCPHAM
jgi:cytochrome c-type biogenesis protein CcmH/NrfG